mmetsp:Transcript_10648/g.34063  ORF Transcript_10648/g.34063 Transcript_10648/m.34063 type:complete len:208 (-) Transcript_10648:9-632(-)
MAEAQCAVDEVVFLDAMGAVNVVLGQVVAQLLGGQLAELVSIGEAGLVVLPLGGTCGVFVLRRLSRSAVFAMLGANLSVRASPRVVFAPRLALLAPPVAVVDDGRDVIVLARHELEEIDRSRLGYDLEGSAEVEESRQLLVPNGKFPVEAEALDLTLRSPCELFFRRLGSRSCRRLGSCRADCRQREPGSERHAQNGPQSHFDPPLL